MSKTFTVYFDTNFFVWLGKADETLATDVINDLNSLDVRHVLSDVLFRELLANGNRPDFDKVLVERVNRFKLTPYCTNEYLRWEGLLPAPEKPLWGDLLMSLDSMSTEANSHSLTASRIADGQFNSEQISELEKSTKPFLEQHGLSLHPENKEESLRSAQVFAESIIKMLKDVLPEGTISGQVEWTDDPIKDSTMLLELLNPKDIETARESNRLKESITSTEDRAYQVAAGIADSRTKRNLAHSLRDSEHMSTFMLHRNEIDALQVDKAQMSLIKRPKPTHRLVELDLSARCFSAGSLQDVVQAIKRLKR